MEYQDTNLKICLGLFSWKDNILYKVHIWQWSDKQYSVHRSIFKAIEKSTSCTFFFCNVSSHCVHSSLFKSCDCKKCDNIGNCIIVNEKVYHCYRDSFTKIRDYQHEKCFLFLLPILEHQVKAMIYKILRNGFLAAFRIAATVSCFLVYERGK